ncbi:hypothetical protein C8Q80DRAFT_1095488 [Daedaleopsis nitida]|nr:hypothetical protein C8Q80DRAFT_1095488 [Daedaleopsis nitida]
MRLMPMVPSPPHHATRFTPEPEPELAIDPLLAAPLHPSNPPPLRWDVAEHPDAIKLGSVSAPGARQLSHDDLASSAARAKGSPLRLRHMTLVFPGLPLTVEIEPDERPVWTMRPLPYLTVGDVLYGLYRSLRLSVEPREFDKLSRELRDSMSRAFDKRLMRDRASSRESVDRNLHHGVRRVDYLGERRQLVGLRPAVGAEVPPGRRKGEVFVVKLAPAQ